MCVVLCVCSLCVCGFVCFKMMMNAINYLRSVCDLGLDTHDIQSILTHSEKAIFIRIEIYTLIPENRY